MVGIILASHGEFANGIFQSGAMIFGEQANVKPCTLMPSEGPEDIRKKMEDAIASFENQEEVLFLVDLWGGTPFNQASALLDGHEDKWAIVTGLNLPMLIETYASRFSMEKAHEIAAHVMQTAQEGVQINPKELEPKEEKKAEVSAAPQGAIPEGTVLGDGHIKYGLARIDTRLLHGQVATAWTKTVGPNRIIVVSDNVAHDDLRKSMIEQAAPPGVKAMLLFETPQDALRAIKGGVDIKELNLGSMAHSQGKVVCTKAVSMGSDDVKTFDELLAMGIKIDVRKVPTDSPENFDEILKKSKNRIKVNLEGDYYVSD